MAVKTLDKQQRVRRARGNGRQAEEILKRLDTTVKVIDMNCYRYLVIRGERTANALKPSSQIVGTIKMLGRKKECVLFIGESIYGIKRVRFPNNH